MNKKVVIILAVFLSFLVMFVVFFDFFFKDSLHSKSYVAGWWADYCTDSDITVYINHNDSYLIKPRKLVLEVTNSLDDEKERYDIASYTDQSDVYITHKDETVYYTLTIKYLSHWGKEYIVNEHTSEIEGKNACPLEEN